MRNSSQRLFIYEMVLAVLILFVMISVTNLIFVRSMTQHKKNQAMMKISEEMVMISEDLQSDNMNSIYRNSIEIKYDNSGNRVESNNQYQLEINIENKEEYDLYHLVLRDNLNVELLAWDIVKVVK